MKTYYAEKEDGSESEVEVLRESNSQEWEDQSHVHFSLDTSYKVKCEVKIVIHNLNITESLTSSSGLQLVN